MVGTVAIIAVGAGLPIGLLPMSGTASGGDPGGAILRELLATKSAAPPGSHPRTAFAKEPEWIGSCSDETLRKGWSVVLGASSFESRLPVAEVQSYVARRLARGLEDGGGRRAPRRVVRQRSVVLHLPHTVDQRAPTEDNGVDLAADFDSRAPAAERIVRAVVDWRNGKPGTPDGVLRRRVTNGHVVDR